MDRTESKIIKRKHDRLESLMLRVLFNALREEVYDKDLKNVSFTYAKLSTDKRNLNVFVDFYNREKLPKLIKKLNENKMVFKRALASNLTVYKIPDVIFTADESIERAMEIERIIRNNK